MSECFYCDKVLSRKLKTRDHVLPKSRHGSSQPNNMVDACRKCNQLKGSLTLEEFRLVIAYQKGLVRKARMLFPGEIRKVK
jgi:5-methylcytosine-specific restriction endonuclease McrA